MKAWTIIVETVEGTITGLLYADSRRAAIRLSEQLGIGRGVRVLRRDAREIFG